MIDKWPIVMFLIGFGAGLIVAGYAAFEQWIEKRRALDVNTALSHRLIETENRLRTEAVKKLYHKYY